MSIGTVSFIFGMAIFAAVFGLKPPRPTGRTLQEKNRASEWQIDLPPVDPDDDSLFNRIIRPTIRNFLPQTPMAAQVQASGSNKVKELLARSGNPWNIQPEEFFGLRLLCAAAAAALALLPLLFGVNLFITIIIATTLASAASFLPQFLLHNHGIERSRDAVLEIPEALDLLATTSSAGMAFTPGLEEVVPRLPDGVAKAELGRVITDLRAGRSVEQSLTSLARRLPGAIVESFAKAVTLGAKLGSPLADTLNSQSEAAREEYEMMKEEQINKLKSNLIFPIMALILPSLLVILGAPTVSVIFTTL